MKAIFNSLMSFEIFFEIFKFINANVRPNSYHLTDVHYNVGKGNQPTPSYGYFRIRATIRDLDLLKKEAVVLQPFGEATDNSKGATTEYTVVVINVRSLSGKYGDLGILFQQRGHMNAPIANTFDRVELGIKEMTNIVLLFPMNESVSSTGNKIMQTQYFVENLIYSKDGEVYIPYNKWEKEIDDLRD